MSEIQRYGFWHDKEWDGQPGEFEPMPEGPYVQFDDHAAALRERDERIEVLEATLRKRDTLLDKWNEKLDSLRAQIEKLSAPVTDAVMEELAAMEHERWSSQAIAALTDMTDARRERWTRQARLLYVGLTEAEKEQDRKQVRKTLAILQSRKGTSA